MGQGSAEDVVHLDRVEDRGLEQPKDSSEKIEGSNSGGAKSGVIHAPFPPDDPRLRAIIDAWPTLPESVREAIMAMVSGSEG